MITNHTQLLNALIEKYNLKSYLEIGVQNPNNNFNKIKCDVKCSIDPDPHAKAIFDCTSDDFFTVNKTIFELIFIDGLHHADQVKRDFENSLRCLSDNGFIVIHDVLPENEAGTIVPRGTKVWWGDVYKWAMTLDEYDGIRFITYNIDNGCCVVKKSKCNIGKRSFIKPTWVNYIEFGHALMNVQDAVTV